MDSTKVNNNFSRTLLIFSFIKNDPHIVVARKAVIQISNVVFQIEGNVITHSEVIIMGAIMNTIIIYVRVSFAFSAVLGVIHSIQREEVIT